MKFLKVYKTHAKILDAISILYKETVAQVITPYGDTE